ncbi:puratrophin-1 isoform X2 [Cololabis saira]|uniref:puratrophin-1 isoform X2 n=1 Tax=Cololabis saira TaxID=129043 RepID=UPI002AD333C8|nr:puratrophin-1 isoform X2 [Cololabis saira]
MAWLDSIDRDREQRGAARLERCLLSAHGDVFRVPWEDLVYPPFIGHAAPQAEEKDGDAKEEKLLPTPVKTDQRAASSDDSEGEYVELSELPLPTPLPRFSPQKGSLTQSISLQHRSRLSVHTPPTVNAAAATRTRSDVPDSSRPRRLSSHTLRCSRLIEDNLNQDHGHVPLTPFTPFFSSSAPPQQARRRPGAVGGEPPHVHSESGPAAGPSPATPEPTATIPRVPAQFPQASQSSQSSQSRFYSVLLRSGAVCLPGTRDVGGRALLTVNACSSVWSHSDWDSAELHRLLLYYTSTLGEEARAAGLTVLVDARRATPAAGLFSALRTLQKDKPGSIHTILILSSKDSALQLDKPAATQVELLSSLKALQKHVDLRQVPLELGGSLSFSQSSWISFRTRLEQLSAQCEDVVVLLQKTISTLQSGPPPAAQRVDELLHRLVMLSNARTQELNFLLDFRGLEQGFTQVRTWLEEVGEVRLRVLEDPADSLEVLNRKQQDYKDFCATAYEHCKRGEALLARLERWDDVSSADLHVYENKVHSFWAALQDFSQRVTSTGQNIERAVQLYRFLDQAYGWALDGMRHLAGISMEDCTLPDKCQDVIGSLQDYQHKHPPIPDRRFQEMKVEAGELRGERGLHQWSFAWSKCQETKKMFDRKMEAAFRTRDSAHRRRSDSTSSRSSTSSRKTLSGFWSSRKTSSFSLEEDASTSSPLTSPSPPTPQHTPLLQRLFRSSSSEESSDQVDMSSPGFSPSSSFFCSRRQQMRKTQSFDSPSTPDLSRYGHCPRALSEPARRGNTGVFIRGLEVSSTETADRTLCPRAAGPRTPTPGTPTADPRPRGSKLRHIVEEMVTTEREYVRSLHYIIQHYFPEMDRDDLPQDLRGKRSIVFGNLEKLLDFHNQFFLRELEACWKHPLRVPCCFLRHQEQFSLYALYSKNKPKSDALLANHGHAFFRRKQLELGDKMDLSSYLLKPIQRMSKYALLLTDLMKEVGVSQEAELATLEDATNMVKFQLRHGNDLLAMDAILDCDVNLKEQGQLIRQDEFTVWSGRRKCQRRIFLFEELVLFSKPKKMEGGLDVFIYKHSFKTADVGLTESAGDNGLKFEIWFRRRTSKNQTFILQPPTAEVKAAWTGDIARILWTQATRNKETRLKEMVSMGVGNKPFLDIQPSDAAISDRAVHYIMKSRGARTRASIAVSVFDHSHPFKRGAGPPDTPPGPSSCSLLGPLNLHMYSQPPPLLCSGRLLLQLLLHRGGGTRDQQPALHDYGEFRLVVPLLVRLHRLRQRLRLLPPAGGAGGGVQPSHPALPPALLVLQETAAQHRPDV